jgi:ATP-dependent DNA helicase 2 subunit 2
VPPKAKGRKDKDDRAKPISGLDIDALLKQPENKRAKISPDKAIPEFKQKVEIADDQADIEDAIKQMGAIIRDMVTKSFGDQDYDRAIEHIGVLRDTTIEYEYPGLFNSFMRDFKTRLLSGEFDGNRRELWWKIKSARLGLVDSNASEHSKVTTEEAAEVSTPCDTLILDISLTLPSQFLKK